MISNYNHLFRQKEDI